MTKAQATQLKRRLFKAGILATVEPDGKRWIVVEVTAAKNHAFPRTWETPQGITPSGA